MPTGMEAARFEQAAAHHPEPPFVLGEKIKDGGTCCYYPECKYKAKTWLRMLDHVRRFHKRNQTTLRGTPLYIMGIEEAAANLRRWRQHRYTSDPASHPEPPFVLGEKIKEGGTCCYYPDCKYRASHWGNMLEHVGHFQGAASTDFGRHAALCHEPGRVGGALEQVMGHVDVNIPAELLHSIAALLDEFDHFLQQKGYETTRVQNASAPPMETMAARL